MCGGDTVYSKELPCIQLISLAGRNRSQEPNMIVRQLPLGCGPPLELQHSSNALDTVVE